MRAGKLLPEEKRKLRQKCKEKKRKERQWIKKKKKSWTGVPQKRRRKRETQLSDVQRPLLAQMKTRHKASSYLNKPQEAKEPLNF